MAGHGDTYVRSRAFSGIKLASLTMVTGAPEEVAAIGVRALRDAVAVRSRRTAGELRELHRLAAPHERLTEVAELRHRIVEVVSGA
ncbi:hypothetical protein ABT340_23135 [Streptosporangium sp. NPDC000239]|uniref:hypothetical protein n=1 Tax=Streptosporangium sp. NPDC000239 TaxID=3154248 RepID=UPI003328A205